jgi:hypothetical protein
MSVSVIISVVAPSIPVVVASSHITSPDVSLLDLARVQDYGSFFENELSDLDEKDGLCSDHCLQASC